MNLLYAFKLFCSASVVYYFFKHLTSTAALQTAVLKTDSDP